MSDVLSQASSGDRVPLRKKMFQRLIGKQRTEEEWNRREEQLRRREQEMKHRMLEFVAMESEEPGSSSMDLLPPSSEYQYN